MVQTGVQMAVLWSLIHEEKPPSELFDMRLEIRSSRQPTHTTGFPKGLLALSGRPGNRLMLNERGAALAP